MKNNTIISIVIVALIVGAGGFFAGTKYQQVKNPAGRFGNFQGNRNGQSQPRNQRFRPVNGEILNIDDKSITVKLRDGSSKIVLLTETTSLNKSTEASKTDLKTGVKVAVFGQENSDGSVTAQNIQLNPTLRMMPKNQPSTIQ